MTRLRTLLPTILAGSAAVLVQTGQAATHNWTNQTNSWLTPTAWTPNGAPPSNPATQLVFGGDVASVAYISTNNIGSAANPFTLNKITLSGNDGNVETSGLRMVIDGNVIRFAGTAPAIERFNTSTANYFIEAPIMFNGELLLSGVGPGVTTLSAGISGIGNITQSGTSTFRFGTKPAIGQEATTPSANTWMGNLNIDQGIIRFNNNAQSASSALRANPVVFVGEGQLLGRRDSGDQASNYSTSLRMGTLMGSSGKVEAQVAGSATSNYDIVITALVDGSYGGSITLPGPNPANDDLDPGIFHVRGPGNQTLTADGSLARLNIYKNSQVGFGATLTLAGNASLADSDNPTGGSTTLAGGSLVLNNSQGNLFVGAGFLRDGAFDSTTIDTIGGGTLKLIGFAGTDLNGHNTEKTGRLQLGSASNPRSGAVRIIVEPTANTAAGLTQISFDSYSRNQSLVPQLSTVEFSAVYNGAGTVLSGPSAKITLHSASFAVPLSNGLLTTTELNGTSVGWATINTGTSLVFASYTPTAGVQAVSSAGSAWNNLPDATKNFQVATAVAQTSGTGGAFQANSIRFQGTAPKLTILGTDILTSTAFLMGAGTDAMIEATGGGAIGGAGPRFFTVVKNGTFKINAPLTGSQNPIVKSGEGTLELNRSHATYDQVVAINQGALRAIPGDTLPRGELRIRGGQLEIQGGGTFSRTISFGPNSVNWTGVDASGANTEVDDDRGSGGFSATLGDANIVLNGSSSSLISWEDIGFLGSGYALTFGSLSATNRVTWTNNLSLSASALTKVDYNAREFYVFNNPGSATDSARISGVISGRVTSDLLKTGPGDLELTGSNSYLGATIVQNGRLFVNGNGESSFLHKVMTGGTLAGKGSIGNVLVDAGGTLAPGLANATASILTTKSLQFTDETSKLSFEIGGAIAGGDGTTGYDQIKALDAVGGATITLNGATLEGTFLNGYLAGVTDIFFLILNDGTDPIVGQFAQGNSVTIGSQNFNISYTANSDLNSFTGGNDVALQLVPEPSSVLLLGLGTLLVTRRRRKLA